MSARFTSRFALSIFLVLLSGHRSAQAIRNARFQRYLPRLPPLEHDTTVSVQSTTGATLPSLTTTYYFDQLIDHDDPTKGTFKQRYWNSWEFYEQGGPIILMTPGEVNADQYIGYLDNITINGLIAQRENGATVLIEHRFFGLSNPYQNLTESSLKMLTIQQAIDDLVYFAQNVDLPMPGGDAVKPDTTPWILTGGSYSGALTAWTMVNKPDVFWAGYASSAVVEAIPDFWRYFEPIREYMPANCSSDVEAIIGFVDEVFTGSNQTAIDYIKDLFGLGVLTHLDDVAGALRYNLWDWQSLQPDSGSGMTFYNFCDALEVKNGVSAPAEGWGVEHALPAWGNFFRGNYTEQTCGTYDIQTCFDTHDANSTVYTNVTIDNHARSWQWILCNELGFFETAAPFGTPSLVSRLVQQTYSELECIGFFPDTFTSTAPPTPNAWLTNTRYKGWDIKVDRLFFANGKRDPWREATMSASTQNLSSTDLQPIALSDGFHMSDFYTDSNVDATIKAVQTDGLNYISTWISQWPSGGSQAPYVDDRGFSQTPMRSA